LEQKYSQGLNTIFVINDISVVLENVLEAKTLNSFLVNLFSFLKHGVDIVVGKRLVKMILQKNCQIWNNYAKKLLHKSIVIASFRDQQPSELSEEFRLRRALPSQLGQCKRNEGKLKGRSPLFP
jgi:hypothetical protein